MRQFERDDELRAAAGDVDAHLRVQRRKDVLSWNSNKRRTALRIAPLRGPTSQLLKPITSRLGDLQL